MPVRTFSISSVSAMVARGLKPLMMSRQRPSESRSKPSSLPPEIMHWSVSCTLCMPSLIKSGSLVGAGCRPKAMGSCSPATWLAVRSPNSVFFRPAMVAAVGPRLIPACRARCPQLRRSDSLLAATPMPPRVQSAVCSLTGLVGCGQWVCLQWWAARQQAACGNGRPAVVDGGPPGHKQDWRAASHGPGSWQPASCWEGAQLWRNCNGRGSGGSL